jgi:hypothetical protein
LRRLTYFRNAGCFGSMADFDETFRLSKPRTGLLPLFAK